MTSPGPVEDDILINKMRPGHEMEMKMFAVKVKIYPNNKSIDYFLS